MKNHRLLYSFVFLLFTLTIFDILGKDIRFSELENRKLAQRPSFSVDDLIDGSFGEEYEEYINDQFIMRNLWINLKSRSEYVLGKIENNGIVYGEDEYLFDKLSKVDEERLQKNTDALKYFLNKYGDKAALMMIPSSYTIYEEIVPYGAPLVNQSEEINKIYDGVEDNTVNLVMLMNENKDKYIYYRTDHHWTTLGAYLAYEAYMSTIDEEAILPSGKLNEVNNFYGTYYSKSKPLNVDGDVLSYYEFDNITMKIEDEIYDSLYDYDYLNKVDKYSTFLRGNNALTIIKNNNLNNGKKLLVIKDSYGNSLVPFLTSNYEEIHVVDLRSFMIHLSDYIEENNFDNILVLYSFVNFAKDTNIIKMKY